MNANQIIERLKISYEFARKKGAIHTKREFAEAIGWKPTHLSSAFNGDASRLTKGLMESIAEAFPQLNKTWLLTGEGEMLAESERGASLTDAGNVNASVNTVPLIPIEAMAGSLDGWTQGVMLRDCKKVFAPMPGVDFAIQISGDSMEPFYHSGMMLYIKRINEAAFIPWGNPMVVDTINGVVVKMLFPSDNKERIIAKSYNSNYPPFEIDTSSIVGVYRILGGSFINSTM